ncbi:MAG: uracil-DNA glycosylase family 4 [Maricaulis sp.]|jgi:uracil-DNA glycosylase family 4
MSLQPEPAADCPLCPRLVAFRQKNAGLYPDWHNGPVGSFGPGDARLLIVGLAPGLRGANRTGRPFTGDWAGDLLFATLATHGFTSGIYASSADDGLRLTDAMITNAVRCVPPENKPVGAEANACRPFLVDRIASLPRLTAILALGKIAHDNTLRALGQKLSSAPFGHNAASDIDTGSGPVRLFSSYHCSRYNTNTGRLTEPMFNAVFADIRTFLDARPQ